MGRAVHGGRVLSGSLFLALVLVLSAGCDAGTDLDRTLMGVLTGTVQDVHTREALGGAVVEFDGRSTRSDRHGRFRLEGVSLGGGGMLRGSLQDGRSGTLQLRGDRAGLSPGAGQSLEVLLSLE